MNSDAYQIDRYSAELLSKAMIQAYIYLKKMAVDEKFNDKFKLAFGNLFDSNLAEDFQQQWAKGDFGELPSIEIELAEDINQAKGAFSEDTDKIYIAKEYLNEHPKTTVDIILEEIGHYVDSQINLKDTPGDEGAIFSVFARGKTLNEKQLKQLRLKDDRTTIELDGNLINIEQNSFHDYQEIRDSLDMKISDIESLDKVEFLFDEVQEVLTENNWQITSKLDSKNDRLQVNITSQDSLTGQVSQILSTELSLSETLNELTELDVFDLDNQQIELLAKNNNSLFDLTSLATELLGNINSVENISIDSLIAAVEDILIIAEAINWNSI